MRDRLSGFSVAAHRGGSTGPDGNTIPRFAAALEAGVDILEMDLRPTRDGVPVVHHDPSIAGARGACARPIAEMTREELGVCRTPSGAAIPTFDEVLAWARGRVVINAEFKDPEVIEPALALVDRYDARGWIYFQTKWDRERYRRARRADPEVALLFKPENLADLEWILAQDDPHLVVIELGDRTNVPEFIERAHLAGKLVSENSWHYSWIDRLVRGRCAHVFEKEIDIAVTDDVHGCIAERDRVSTERQPAEDRRLAADEGPGGRESGM